MLGVTLGRVINRATNRADILARALLLAVIHFRRNRHWHIIEVNDFPACQIFIAQRRMRGQINGLMAGDKGTHLVERVSGRCLILGGNRQLVLIKGFIRIGHIAVDNVMQTFIFHDNDAVAGRMAGGKDIINTLGNLLALVKVFISTIGKINPDNIIAL